MIPIPPCDHDGCPVTRCLKKRLRVHRCKWCTRRCGSKQSKRCHESVCQKRKPSHYQVGWVFRKLMDHAREPGTYRYLIYDRMGFDMTAYHTLYEAGGMHLSNIFFEHAEMKKMLKAAIRHLPEIKRGKAEEFLRSVW